MTDDARNPVFNIASTTDLVELLPYLIGYHVDASIVAFTLSGSVSGSACRIDLPADVSDWPQAASEFIAPLASMLDRRGATPDAVVLYLCPDVREGEQPADAMHRLRPLADLLVQACERHQLTAEEVLCVGMERWWSYRCTDASCCGADGHPLPDHTSPGTMTIAATYAGRPLPRRREDILADLAPVQGREAAAMSDSIDSATEQWRSEVKASGEQAVIDRVVHLLDTVLQAQGAADSTPPITDPVAAQLILALQYREVRDRAAEYFEQDELPRARELWKDLARRCVDPYQQFAAAPLTLFGWVSWNSQDAATARLAFRAALDASPEYVLADLLFDTLNAGLGPEGLQGILRGERADRAAEASG